MGRARVSFAIQQEKNLIEFTGGCTTTLKKYTLPILLIVKASRIIYRNPNAACMLIACCLYADSIMDV